MEGFEEIRRLNESKILYVALFEIDLHQWKEKRC